MKMTPEEMMELKKKAGEKEPESLVDMANKVKSMLEKFNSAIGSSKASDEEKAQMGGVYSEFMDLVENKLGQDYESEESEENMEDKTKMVPMMAGTTGVPESHAFKKQ